MFSVNQRHGVTPSSMVLIGVGMQTALYGGSITLMSKFDKDQSEFIATWFAGNIWGDEWIFVIAFYHGSSSYCHIYFINLMN